MPLRPDRRERRQVLASAESMDDACSSHRSSISFDSVRTPQMSRHDRPAMLLEVTHQLLHPVRISKAALQSGPLSQKDAEIPDRSGVPGNQGVIATSVERHDIAHSGASSEGIDKREPTSARLHCEEYGDNLIHLVRWQEVAGLRRRVVHGARLSVWVPAIR
jgi:hypothetical protein